jgi:glutathione S-transferase
MLKIYGQKASRALRCLWACEELNAPYEHVPLNQNTGETRTAEYLAINPSGKIPAMVHDGFVLTETVAINWYLAGTFAGNLLPRSIADQAKVQQWTSWALTEVEPCLVSMFREGRKPKEHQDPTRVEAWRADALKQIQIVLEPHLADRAHLLGAAFTLADLNAASILSPVAVIGIDISSLPNTDAWLKRCLGRDAFKRASARA